MIELCSGVEGKMLSIIELSSRVRVTLITALSKWFEYIPLCLFLITWEGSIYSICSQIYI